MRNISCLFVLGNICVSITTVCCFLRFSADDDVEFEDVFIRFQEGKRTRRSAKENLNPSTYDFDISVAGSALHVHLRRNDHIKTNVPTLTVSQGLIRTLSLMDKEESVFYQDIRNGGVFVIQNDKTNGSNMFGVLRVNGEKYILQTYEKTILWSGYNKFQIVKETHQNITFKDILKQQIPQNEEYGVHHRQKRASGSYHIELLVVVDFSIFQYWYDKSTKPTTLEREEEALITVRQFYAFVINGVDAMYKNIQTSAYTLAVEFAGITIAQTPSDSTWTESIAVTSTVPYQVDSSDALNNFRTWVQSSSGSLPGHDHAMLFTRYDLTSGGSSGNAGLAYVSAVCTSSSQSIVEDHFNFIVLTVASHELGHSLSAAHDGDGNLCSYSEANIMASSTSPQTSDSTATNLWKFSSCSTDYFTSYINSLEASSANCMSVLSVGFNSSALSEYENDMPGQVYDADKQCENIRGFGSYFCKDRYSGDFSTICSVLWCSDPVNTGYCSTSIAADGTLCGDKQWCVTGVCTYDSRAPSGTSSCLYGDMEGQIFSNQPWNCSDIAKIAPYNCPVVPIKCCDSCAPYISTTTSTTSLPTSSSWLTSGNESTMTHVLSLSETTTNSPISTHITGADIQCETSKGTGSFMCRSLYGGDYTSICSTLWCSNPTNASQCHSETASDGTLCGNKKWCISGVCTADQNAPTGDDSCLYGDRIGPIFTNGWSCVDMVANAPHNCPSVPVACCYSCKSPTTTESLRTDLNFSPTASKLFTGPTVNSLTTYYAMSPSVSTSSPSPVVSMSSSISSNGQEITTRNWTEITTQPSISTFGQYVATSSSVSTQSPYETTSSLISKQGPNITKSLLSPSHSSDITTASPIFNFVSDVSKSSPVTTHGPTSESDTSGSYTTVRSLSQTNRSDITVQSPSTTLGLDATMQSSSRTRGLETTVPLRTHRQGETKKHTSTYTTVYSQQEQSTSFSLIQDRMTTSETFSLTGAVTSISTDSKPVLVHLNFDSGASSVTKKLMMWRLLIAALIIVIP